MAALTEASHPAAAEAFVAFVLSDRGRAVLNAFGFGAP
ncbi:MAG: substrate-binding domain-containing protein [Microbacterium sp.]